MTTLRPAARRQGESPSPPGVRNPELRTIPLRAIEQSASSPRATGGGVFGQAYRIEATVQDLHHDSEPQELFLGPKKHTLL